MGLRAPTPSSITVGRTQLPSLSGGLVSPGGSISSSAGLASPSPLAGLSGLASQEPQLLSDEQRSLFNKRVLQLYRDIRQTTQLQQLQGLPAQLTFRDICKATNKKMVLYCISQWLLLHMRKSRASSVLLPCQVQVSPIVNARNSAGGHQVLHIALPGQDARRSARAAGALRRHRDLAGRAHRRAERGALAGLEPRRISAAGRERVLRAAAVSAELSNAPWLVATAVRGVGLGARRSAAARLAAQRRVRRR